MPLAFAVQLDKSHDCTRQWGASFLELAQIQFLPNLGFAHYEAGMEYGNP